MSSPFGLLTTSYGIAAASAIYAANAGAEIWQSALGFWFGGPVLVVALAACPWVRLLFTSERPLPARRRKTLAYRTAGFAPGTYRAAEPFAASVHSRSQAPDFDRA